MPPSNTPASTIKALLVPASGSGPKGGPLKRFTSVNSSWEKFTPTSGPGGRLSTPGGKPCCTINPAVRELIAARGSTYANPPANFYRANRDPVTRAETVAQVFLGTRLQCAQCHNHPFDRWTQRDYYDWAAVFGKVQYKVLENRRQDSNDSHEFKGEQIVYLAREGAVKNPRTGQAAEPRMLGDENSLNRLTVASLHREEADSSSTVQRFNGSTSDELTSLAQWIASPDNPFFARAQVNRIWYHLMGRGLVDPIDDFRATNPASHPALLDQLARDFVRHKFDVRHVIRLIMNSRTYQLSSEPNETNREEDMNYSRALVRRLSAEQLLDCQHAALDVEQEFSGYPVGLRAAQLPGVHSIRARRTRGNPIDQFLTLFGKPPRLLACECERSSEPTMSQAFQLISGPSLNELLKESENRIAMLLASGKPDSEIIDELYWTVLTRAPAADERTAMKAHLASKDRRAALEDVTWALLNSKEFVLRR